MHRLEAHSDLQFAVKQIAKAQAGIADERGMILYDQPLEAVGALRDGGVVSRRNCLRIEKAAAVIELELARRRKVEKRVIDLGRDRSGRYAFR